MYTKGSYTPHVHVADHVTYCYTVFWTVERDMLILVSEPGFEFGI